MPTSLAIVVSALAALAPNIINASNIVCNGDPNGRAIGFDLPCTLGGAPEPEDPGAGSGGHFSGAGCAGTIGTIMSTDCSTAYADSADAGFGNGNLCATDWTSGWSTSCDSSGNVTSIMYVDSNNAVTVYDECYQPDENDAPETRDCNGSIGIATDWVPISFCCTYDAYTSATDTALLAAANAASGSGKRRRR